MYPVSFPPAQMRASEEEIDSSRVMHIKMDAASLIPPVLQKVENEGDVKRSACRKDVTDLFNTF